MQTIAIAQAKNNFSALLHAVESGQNVVLTRHGKPVVRMVPEVQAQTPDLQREQVLAQEAMTLLGAFRAKVKPGLALDWKELRDAGRKY